MKKSRSFFALLIVSLSLVLIPGTAKADLWDVPVAPGESFRWVFVTSGARDATSSDISVYNQFVNDAADAAGTPISGVVGKSSIADIEWFAIASTPDVPAIHNIGVSSAGIYTPLGTLVANGTGDLWDGSIHNPISITETGLTVGRYVWTGTHPVGGLQYYEGLGRYQYICPGHTQRTDYRWAIFVNAWHPIDYSLSLYGISEELTVVPAPGALILAAIGLLSSTLGLKRLRRKR